MRLTDLLTPANVIYFILFSFVAVLIVVIAFSLPESVHVVEAKVTSCISAQRFRIKMGSPYYDCELNLPGIERPVMAMSSDDYSGKRVMVRIARQPAINQTNYFIYGLAPGEKY